WPASAPARRPDAGRRSSSATADQEDDLAAPCGVCGFVALAARRERRRRTERLFGLGGRVAAGGTALCSASGAAPPIGIAIAVACRAPSLAAVCSPAEGACGSASALFDGGDGGASAGKASSVGKG